MNVLLLAVASVMFFVLSTQAAITVSLKLQGDCSAQLTLICRHSDDGSPPVWIHNGTVQSGSTIGDAFPGAMYTVLTRTEHTTTITGVDAVRALDGYIFQCGYEDLGNLIKSNVVKYTFIPPDYRPALSSVSFTAEFSERLCTFTYSFNKSCNLYPRCTPYFSVEHTVSPQWPVSNSFSGCSVGYTIHNLMRCESYQSTATALLGNQRGNPVVMGDTVMQSPGRFTITGVSIGADRDLINMTYKENESDCPGYPTEWYTVDVDGVQVADLTADEFQSQAINHANGSVILSLTLSQQLPKNATTLNMTKYNSVPTNRSDDTGNVVTVMVTWRTSAVSDLSQESSAAMNGKVHAGAVSVGGVVGAVISVTTIFVVITIAVALVIARRQKAKVCGTCDLKATDDTPNEVHGQCGCRPTPAAASQGPQPVKDTNEQPVPMTDKAGSEEEAPLTVAEMSEEGSNALTNEDVDSDEEVEPPPSPAAETVDETLEVCKPERECHPVTESTKAAAYVVGDGCKRIRRQPKWALTRGNTAGRVEPQETEKTICSFKNDPSTYYISGDKAIPV